MTTVTKLLAAALLVGGLAAPLVAAAKPYPASVRRAFITGCAKEGATSEACGCLIDAIARRTPLERFLALAVDDELDKQAVARLAAPAMIDCADVVFADDDTF